MRAAQSMSKQVAPELRGRAAVERDRLDHLELRVRDAVLPLRLVAVDRVALGRPSRSSTTKRFGPPSPPPGGSKRMRSSHQLRVRPSMPGTPRRTRFHTRGKSSSASSASTKRSEPTRLEAAARTPSTPAELDLARERRHAVAEAPVDRLLRRPQERHRLAALVNVVELGAHHRAQDAAPPVRRETSRRPSRPPSARRRPARSSRTETHRRRRRSSRPPARRACARCGRFFEKRSMRSSVGSMREVLPDREDRVAELLEVGAGRDCEAQAIFSRGAYSTISLRSVPSCAKRTVTTPPGSIPVTTPSPSEPWRTESPVESAMSGRGSIAAAAGDP